jgi:hypothetical protein
MFESVRNYANVEEDIFMKMLMKNLGLVKFDIEIILTLLKSLS